MSNDRSGDIITGGHLHLLRLALKDADADGWAKVSAQVWPLVEHISTKLLERNYGNRTVRVTHDGKVILEFSQSLSKIGKQS